MRVKYANDDHSFREKFALVIWIGEDVKVMRRAKVSYAEPRQAGPSGLAVCCAVFPVEWCDALITELTPGVRPHWIRQGGHPQLRRRDLRVEPR